MPTFSVNPALVILLLVLLAVLLMGMASYMIWQSLQGPQARKMARRLQALTVSLDRSPQTVLLKERLLSQVPLLQRWLTHLPRVHWLDHFILQAGLRWTVGWVLLSCLTLGLGGAVLLLMLWPQPPTLVLPAALLCALLPWLYVARQRARRMAQLERQLPEALDLMARALKSGHAFLSALQMVGEEMPEPLAGEFRLVHDEVNFGVSLQQALTHLAERVPLTDLRYFVVAVLIQRDTGGNLTEVLGKLSRLIRERLKLLAKVRVLSSEARMSAWVLGLMPFALGALMSLFNPRFMAPLWTDPMGLTILKSLLLMMALGVFMLQKIVRIRV